MTTATVTPEDEGYAAGLARAGIGSNPYSMAQGSPTRVAGIAWNKGYRRGVNAADAADDAQESAGHFRDRG